MLNSKYVLNILEELCKTASPSGYTHKAMRIVEQELVSLGYKVNYTNKGALVSYIEGKNQKVSKSLTAHIDTLGAMVKEIKPNGRLAISMVGYYYGSSVECENCYIHTLEDKTFSGTIYTTKPSIHVYADARTLERSIENLEVVVDEKVFSKQDILDFGIEIGDFISFDSRFKVTDAGFVKTRHLDDKASVAIILGVCKYLKENNITPDETIQIFISNYEEIGHGASYGIHEEVEELLCVDMGAPGVGQNTDEYTVSICAKDSGGPYDYELKNKLVSLAKQNGIGYKIDIYPIYNSDGGVALKAGKNIRVGLIGPGVYASHSYERTHIDSILNTAKLLIAYVQQ
jgi:putative aminopeptidase FrvX